MFRKGLNNVHTEMACRDDQASLDILIDLAIRLDNLLHDRSSAQPRTYQQKESIPTAEPMQLGNLRYNATARRRKQRNQKCCHCNASTIKSLQHAEHAEPLQSGPSSGVHPYKTTLAVNKPDYENKPPFVLGTVHPSYRTFPAYSHD